LISEILESYDRSPFLVPNAENFLDSRDRGEYQGERALGIFLTFCNISQVIGFQILQDTID